MRVRGEEDSLDVVYHRHGTERPRVSRRLGEVRRMGEE